MLAGWITRGYENRRLVAKQILITQVHHAFGGSASVIRGVYSLLSPKANTQTSGNTT